MTSESHQETQLEPPWIGQQRAARSEVRVRAVLRDEPVDRPRVHVRVVENVEHADAESRAHGPDQKLLLELKVPTLVREDPRLPARVEEHLGEPRTEEVAVDDRDARSRA